jgi:phosphoribosyl-ATP pyrophosphohydrolase/phosphoribosyl-AMP cyclohydrolase
MIPTPVEGSVVAAARATPDLAWGEGGLVPGIVQDARDGRVLMLGWLDAESLAATLATGEVHFHSRSRGRLWRKGETSGNVLRLRDLAVDCDADALLLTVDPAGPTCHRGTRSCFDPADVAAGVAGLAEAGPVGAGDGPDDRPDADGSGRATGGPGAQGFAWLERLWATIDARANARPDGSYTAALLGAGVDASVRKVAEEATEVVLAAKDDDEAERRETAMAWAVPGAITRAGVERVITRDRLADEVADLLFHVLVVLRERGMEPAAVIERLRERHRP